MSKSDKTLATELKLCRQCHHEKPIIEFKQRQNGNYQKTCNSCCEKITSYRTCEHGKYKPTCSICNSIEKCEHDKLCSECDICKTKQICILCHELLSLKKFDVKKTGGYTKTCKVCTAKAKTHRKCIKWTGENIPVQCCIRCNHEKPFSEFKQLPNKKYNKKCKICCEKLIKLQKCEHGKCKSECTECDSKYVCVHSKLKINCIECMGRNICCHLKRKQFCLECNGSAFCAHGKRKAYCKEHGNGKKLCLSPWCETIVSKKFKHYCLQCFIHLFPDEAVSHNYRTKEKTIVDSITNRFKKYTWVPNKKVQDGCSKRRPDLLLDLGNQVLIIEIDENQHIDYDCSCENKRLMELSQDVGHRPLVFIRFNPDGYIDTAGKKIKSCWTIDSHGVAIINKKNEPLWKDRMKQLKSQIKYWIKNETGKTVEVVQLFYDQNIK